jgi:dUTP pyrophosphatase
MAPVIKVKCLRKDVLPPTYGTSGSSCFDLFADINDEGEQFITIPPGGSEVVHTSLAFEIPDGYVMLLFSRSGHGFNWDVRLSNCVGVIDSDYRGEVLVKMRNDGLESYRVNDYDKIAQGLVILNPRLKIVKVSQLSDTTRGTKGFGSTGR